MSNEISDSTAAIVGLAEGGVIGIVIGWFITMIVKDNKFDRKISNLEAELRPTKAYHATSTYPEVHILDVVTQKTL